MEAGGARLEWRPEAFLAGLEAEMGRRVAVCCELVKAMAQRLLSSSGGPSRPGEPPHAVTSALRNSIFARYEGLKGEVGTPYPYGLWLEHGVPGGVAITPKNAKALSWVDASGTRHFAARVTQGEIKPRPWLRPALARSERAAQKVMLAPWDGRPPAGALSVTPA